MPEAQGAEVPTAPVTPPAKGRFEIPVFAESTPEVVAPATPSEPEAPAPAEAVEAPTDQNTGEQAPPATPEGEKPEEVTPEQAAKRRQNRLDRKLDKAYRQKAEAQARAEFLEKRVAELERPKAPEGEPKLEQFDYDPEKYATAKAEYAKTQAAKELETKQKAETAKQAQAKLLTAWEEKVTRAEDKYDDWQEKVGELQPTNALISAIMEADNGEDVAYYLGTHPKEAQRLAQLSPLSQVREIGKLEAKLASTPEKPKAPSKAPAPITPLKGVAATAAPEPSESDDMKTWMRKRQKQVHGVR